MFKFLGMTYKKTLQPAPNFTSSHLVLILPESAPVLQAFHLVGWSLFHTCTCYPAFQWLTSQYPTRLQTAPWSLFPYPGSSRVPDKSIFNEMNVHYFSPHENLLSGRTKNQRCTLLPQHDVMVQHLAISFFPATPPV